MNHDPITAGRIRRFLSRATTPELRQQISDLLTATGDFDEFYGLSSRSDWLYAMTDAMRREDETAWSDDIRMTVWRGDEPIMGGVARVANAGLTWVPDDVFTLLPGDELRLDDGTAIIGFTWGAEGTTIEEVTIRLSLS